MKATDCIVENGALIKVCDPCAPEVIIPSGVKYLGLWEKLPQETIQKLIANEEGPFVCNEYIRAVIMPDTVEYMGIKTFENCTNLVYVRLSEKLRYYDACSFSGCRSLQMLRLPKSLTHVRDFSFDGCDALHEIHYDGTLEEFRKIKVDQEDNINEDINLLCSDCYIPLAKYRDDDWIANFFDADDKKSFLTDYYRDIHWNRKKKGE